MNFEHQITSDESRATPVNDIQGQARHGFSLTEVILAVGILAVGMLFIAGAFPVSIHFTIATTERAIAATVADEAFAKIKLYGAPVVLSDTNQALFTPAVVVPSGEYAYPSTADPNSKRYWWAAICRRVGPSDVQVTVFVSRKVGMTTTYNLRNPLPPENLVSVDRPVPVFVSVIAGSRADELLINDALVPFNFINDSYTVADDATGNIYRVLERYRPPNDGVIRLDKDWQGAISRVWIVPPPVNKGRYPCIGVYQKIMRF